MKENEVRIITLEPMRLATFLGFGTEPEHQAFNAMLTWAKEHGLYGEGQTPRLFGFNNPDPSPGSPNYGYEVWLQVDDTVEIDSEAKEHRFSGGLYAVLRCDVKDPYQDIGATWKRLVNWREASQYQQAHHQWMEEHISPVNLDSPEFVLDLYLPIAE